MPDENPVPIEINYAQGMQPERSLLVTYQDQQKILNAGESVTVYIDPVSWEGRSVNITLIKYNPQSRDIVYKERRCEKCDFVGRFIDDDTTCPNCKLVQ